MALKIIHIFNHDKFVDQYIANIKPGNFENTFIFLKNENTYSASSQIVKHVVPYSKDYYEIIEECVLYDIIILYDLDKEKINIVNRLQYNNATIIWVFYGADLYSLPELKERLFSDETVNLLDLNIARNISYYFKRIIRPIYQYFKGNKSSIVARRQAIAKIDFFALYGREEYDYLNNKLKNKLPQFIEYLVAATFTSIPYTTEKSDSILVGNSASPYNNHIDIIKKLEKLNYTGRVTIPFNYGSNKKYIEKFRDEIKKYKVSICMLDNFVALDEYISLIQQHSAAVFYSYRQMAMGNIFIALCSGVKVYLSKQNPSLSWFERVGFKIFNVETDLETDVLTSNLKLSKESMVLNRKVYYQVVKDINSGFLTKLAEIGKTKRSA